MRPIVTNRVALSVGRSVCDSCEPCETAKPIDMSFGLWAVVAQETMY